MQATGPVRLARRTGRCGRLGLKLQIELQIELLIRHQRRLQLQVLGLQAHHRPLAGGLMGLLELVA